MRSLNLQVTTHKFVIFITGGAVLALQLVASRVMTPFFGVSLYVWTSILSTTLLFLAVGYALGGRATRRYRQEQVDLQFHGIPAVAALTLIAASASYPFFFRDLALWHLVMGSFVASTVLLAVPLVLLAALNPLLVSMHQATGHGSEADAGSGHVFFLSTLGSVAGVLVAAFVILPAFTNYQAMLIIGAGLALVSLLAASLNPLPGRGRVMIWGMSVVAIVATLLLWQLDQRMQERLIVGDRGETYQVLAVRPSPFGTVRVIQQSGHGYPWLEGRMLVTSETIQNVISPDNREVYLFAHALPAIAIANVPDAQRALVLGQGAGMVPAALRRHGLDATVVELNPVVSEMAQRFFTDPEDPVYSVVNADARTFVRNCEAPYDIVIADLFHGMSVPEHLVTREFFHDVRRCMAPGAVLVLNMHYSHTLARAEQHMLATLVEVFSDVAMARHVPGDWPVVNSYLWVRRDAEPARVSARHVPEAILPADFRRPLNRVMQHYRRFREVPGFEPLTDHAAQWRGLTLAFEVERRRLMLETFPEQFLIN